MGLTGLPSRCWQGCVLSGGSRGESVSWPFPASRGRLPALARGPSSTLTASNDVTDLCVHGLVSLSDPPASLFHLLRTLMITLGPLDEPGLAPTSRSLTSSYLQSPFCHVRWLIHKFQGLGLDIFGDHYSTDHTSMSLYCFFLIHLSFPYYLDYTLYWFQELCGFSLSRSEDFTLTLPLSLIPQRVVNSASVPYRANSYAAISCPFFSASAVLGLLVAFMSVLQFSLIISRVSPGILRDPSWNPLRSLWP